MKYLSICSISFLILITISISFFTSSLVFSTSIVMTFLFDWMSLLFMSFVLLIASLVIYYSKDYMSGDTNINHFIMLVLMFVLSMMLLIISPNLISMLRQLLRLFRP